MAYENNTRLLARWAEAGTWNGPEAAKHMARFFTLKEDHRVDLQRFG